MAVQLKVSDIKQYFYCPRVVYFEYCQPVEKKVSYKMEEGNAAQKALEILEKRRTLARYGLENGKRHFGINLVSDNLNLSGNLDLLVENKKGYFPVEFKNAFAPAKIPFNHKLQLTAYGMLVESNYDIIVSKGFLYYLLNEEVKTVRFTLDLRNLVLEAIKGTREIIEAGIFPEPPKYKNKCVDCEFLRHCGDRY